MRARFDQFAKGIFREALAPAGTVRNQDEVVAEAQAIDTRFDPDPARAHALDGLGCLGEMARVPCLFEAFHGTVDIAELRSCVRKQLTVDHIESSRARRKKRPAPVFPYLWVLTSGRPETVLSGYSFAPIPSFPAGFLQRSEADALGLVVLRELPRTRATLLLRLMAAGAVLDDAVAELERLPADAREREVTLTSLVAFRKEISHDPTDEERAFLMSTSAVYDQWKKEVRKEGRKEGREEGQRAMLLDLLRSRFGELPRAAVARVKAADAAQLGRWAKRVLTAAALDEVFGDR